MITSSVNRVIYKGNGVATEFAYPFKIFNRTDIKVLLVDKDGNRSILTSDYYVDMEAMKVYYPGYAPGAEEPEGDRPDILQEGETLVVYREVPITQMDRMPENYPFNVNEQMHDKSCVIDQQLADAVNRGLSASVDAPEGFVGDVPIVAGKSFRISSDGMRLETTEDPARVLPLAQALLEQTAAAAESAGISADITQEDLRAVIEIRNTFPQTVAAANAALNQTKEGYKGELQDAYDEHSNALNQEFAGYTSELTDKRVEAVSAISEAKGDATGTIASDKSSAVGAVNNAKSDAISAISADKATVEELTRLAQQYKDLAYQYMQGSVNIPVGFTMPWFINDKIPVGFIQYTEEELDGDTYPSLWELYHDKYGMSGKKFKLPPNLYGRFLEISLVAGEYHEAGLPNIEGNLRGVVTDPWNYPLSGAFYYKNNKYGTIDYASGDGAQININANLSNPIYGNSDTVQPPSCTVILIVKAFAGASPSSSDLEITRVANDVIVLGNRLSTLSDNKAGLLDYSRAITLDDCNMWNTNNIFTAPTNGVFYVCCYNWATERTKYFINDTMMLYTNNNAPSSASLSYPSLSFIVSEGDVLKIIKNDNLYENIYKSVVFVPFKEV